MSNALNSKNIFNSKDILIDSMKNFLSNNSNFSFNEISYKEKINYENIYVENIDYYYSNVIARASKTMSECRNAKIKLKKTGTEG